MNTLLCNIFVILASFLFMTLQGFNLTTTNLLPNGQIKLERGEKNHNGCNNQLLLKIIKNEMSHEKLPSHSLLMTSKIYDIKELFQNFFEDKELSKIVKECGEYTYLKHLKMVIFTINENVNIQHLQRFFGILINNDICVEFNQSAGIQ
ncbi:hypothetical protein, conserved [Plasmodium gonderi]|uniref:Uncharacterized protein n=1 Tax=Plasmodium gonderi TaxID=77519 RepID=A0A1Y1JG34_PLAGO|nr:hypothetical protein, conserved [Plasmodium gonderi]GAW81481.1 hypothetical protein, conserved [Plasmodium gonderi]